MSFAWKPAHFELWWCVTSSYDRVCRKLCFISWFFSHWRRCRIWKGVYWNVCLFHFIFIYTFFLTWNQHFWAYTLREITIFRSPSWAPTILLFSKWNQHPCRHTLTSNQHFNLFRPEINIFEFIRCVKLTFCCFLSEINILAVTR